MILYNGQNLCCLRIIYWRNKIRNCTMIKIFKKLNFRLNELKPAFFWSFGWPALERTSRSTRLRDMSPRVRPDIRPAKATRIADMVTYTQNIDWQHGKSFAAINVLFDKLNTDWSSIYIYDCKAREWGMEWVNGMGVYIDYGIIPWGLILDQP